VEGTIVGMIPSVRGCHPPPRPSLRTIPLLGEMVNLLVTYGASRGSRTTYVVLRRCTYLVGAHALRARIFFLGTRVLVYHGLYVKVPAHVRERNNTTGTIITTLRLVYFWTSRLKWWIFSPLRS
jgi:hypothetical protein